MDDPASPEPDPSSAHPPRSSRGPGRIRSVPDRPGGTGPTGTIRSVPNQSRTSARPPGTYAASFGVEKSWLRGLGILWALFTLTMLLEALNAAFYLLAGKIAWPPNSVLALGETHLVLPIAVGRLAVGCTCFVGLWAGWGWLRYLLATADFFSGLWLLVSTVASYQAAPKFKATGIADAPIYSAIESFPKMGLGIFYLVTAAYVIFSIDVQEFVAHRRAQGRVGSALLVAAAAYGCMALILGAQPIYNSWLHTQRLGAMAFGEDTLRVMADRWAADSIDDRLDPAFAEQFTPDGRQAAFANFKDLGPLRNPHTVPLTVITTVQSNPLQNIVPAPIDIFTGVTRDGNGFQMVSRYNTTGATYAHGEARFGLDLVRSLFGPWRVRGLDVGSLRIDPPPKPAPSPDASPAPATPAATPVPSTGG